MHGGGECVATTLSSYGFHLNDKNTGCSPTTGLGAELKTHKQVCELGAESKSYPSLLGKPGQESSSCRLEASRIPRGLLTQPLHRSLPAPASLSGTSPGPGRRNLNLPTRAASPNKPLCVLLQVPSRLGAVRGRGKPPEGFFTFIRKRHRRMKSEDQSWEKEHCVQQQEGRHASGRRCPLPTRS